VILYRSVRKEEKHRLAEIGSSALPDGIFSNQKSQFGKILDGFAMEGVGLFYGHLVYFTAIGYILL
jgi:hypothetical protein